MNLLYSCNRFLALSSLERKLFIRGFIFAALVSLIIKLLPMKCYFFLFKTKPKYLIPEIETSYVVQIVLKTTRRITKFSPWHSNCLIKSMIIKNLLDSLGVNSIVSFSIYKNETALLCAHAYLKLDNYRNIFMKQNFVDVHVVY